MSKVSDLEFVHLEGLRNGVVLAVDESSLGVRSPTINKESEAQSKSKAAASGKDDMEIDLTVASNSGGAADNGTSSASRIESLHTANDVSGANSSSSSTVTGELHRLIDTLPVVSHLQGDTSNDVTDPMDVVHDASSKSYAPRATSRGTLRSMGPYVAHCSKHYEERSHIPSGQTAVDKSLALFVDASDSASIPQTSLESDALPPQEPTSIREPTNSPRKRLYISRTLQQLEDATKNWFTRENRTVAGSSPPQPKDAIDLFSLKYNESSVSTIAAWVAGGATRKRSSTNFHRPIVDTRFRSCSNCGMYGHYEVECHSLSPDQMIKLSRILSGEATVTNEYSTMKIKWHEYDVVVETCDGFFIEQQSNDIYSVDTQNTSSNNGLDGVEKPSQESQRPIEDGKKIEIDGFLISEFPTVISQSNPGSADVTVPETKSAPIQVGNLVTWFLNESSDNISSVPDTVLAGTVSKIDVDAGLVQVKVLRLVCAESKSVGRYRSVANTYSSLGSHIWVSAESLYLVDEQNVVLQNSKNLSKNPKKAAKANVVKRSRKKKPEKVVSKHRQIGRPKLNSDNFSKNTKRNRRPNGLVWDEALGVWVLPTV